MTATLCPTCGLPLQPLTLHRCRLWATDSAECQECETRHWTDSLHDGLCARCLAERAELALKEAFND